MSTRRTLRASRPSSEDTAPDEASNPARAYTQVFRLEHIEPNRVDQLVKPFLSEDGGNTIQSAEQRLLIVTDYVHNMRRVGELIALLDAPGAETELETVTIQHMSAKDAASELQKLIAASRKAAGLAAGAQPGVEIVEQARTNALIFVGRPEAVRDAKAVVARVDVALDVPTRVYRFERASPKQIDELARGLLGESGAARYQSVVDEAAQVLVVSAPEEIHSQVESLRRDLDTEAPDVEMSVKFHKLANAKAGEVLATIQQIESTGADVSPLGFSRSTQTDRERPALGGVSESFSPNVNGGGAAGVRAGTESTFPGARAGGARSASLRSRSTRAAPTARAIDAGGARLVADPTTNAIIVRARPADHARLAELIRELDKRRPQVLIELTMVTLDTSSSFSLAVELSKLEEGSDGRSLAFSSFGLSEVDTTTGALSLIPGLGFNGAVIDTDVADGVIRALASHGRSKVLSAPKILVNDNATGTLNSVLDAPFTSVNASTTVATTTFGGFENAGTTISVTPHISEGDHLSLEYSITLSTFTGPTSSGTPPPRQRNELQSEVTIPDGHTIIIGGLTRSDISETTTKVPVLGDIPLLGALFRSQSDSDTSSTLFAFIRPVILRDDQFSALKYLSETDLVRAEQPLSFPESRPLLIH